MRQREEQRCGLAGVQEVVRERKKSHVGLKTEGGRPGGVEGLLQKALLSIQGPSQAA